MNAGRAKDIHRDVHYNLPWNSMSSSPSLGFINYRAICERERLFLLLKQFSTVSKAIFKCMGNLATFYSKESNESSPLNSK